MVEPHREIKGGDCLLNAADTAGTESSEATQPRAETDNLADGPTSWQPDGEDGVLPIGGAGFSSGGHGSKSEDEEGVGEARNCSSSHPDAPDTKHPRQSICETSGVEAGDPPNSSPGEEKTDSLKNKTPDHEKIVNEELSGDLSAAQGLLTLFQMDVSRGAAAAKIFPSNENGEKSGASLDHRDAEVGKGADPITQGCLGKNTFRFVRANREPTVYNVESIVDCLLSTCSFVEPFSRIPLLDEELRFIDDEAKRAGLSKPSVVDAKANPKYLEKRKIRQDCLDGLERAMSDLVTEMLSVIEGNDREIGEVVLLTQLLPNLAKLYTDMKVIDPDHARLCMAHYRTWLRGPKNCPTGGQGEYRNLGQVHFLKDVLENLSNIEDGRLSYQSLGFVD